MEYITALLCVAQNNRERGGDPTAGCSCFMLVLQLREARLLAQGRI